MDLQEKTNRFVQIAEEANDFNHRILMRFQRNNWNRIYFDSEFQRLVFKHAKFRSNLLMSETPPELAQLLAKAMTPADRASPYADILLARFSLPALAAYANKELQLSVDEVEAIESLTKLRADKQAGTARQKVIAFALGFLSWITSAIPAEVLTAVGINKETFIPLAFAFGVGGVLFALLIYGAAVWSDGKLKTQYALTTDLLVYCKAQLKTSTTETTVQRPPLNAPPSAPTS